MDIQQWQPQEIIHAISFDCDGTLSNIEGIDEVAKLNHCKNDVAKLTHEAMSLTGLSKSLYKQRLDLVKPTQSQTETLAEIYLQNVTLDCIQTINILKRMNKSIYIISAGNNPAVSLFGEKLSVPAENCSAINLFFNEDGSYKGYDSDSPLCDSAGKIGILSNIKQKHNTVLHIGDGLNDTPAVNTVTRFIGYGGHYFRKNIADLSPFYLSCESLLALLPLTLTQEEVNQLNPDDAIQYKTGCELLNDHLHIK